MFKKIISALIVFIAMFGCISYGAVIDKDQWQWYYSDDHQSAYFNPASVTYDKKSNTATVWRKYEIIGRETPLTLHIKIDFSNKTAQMIGYITSEGKEGYVYNHPKDDIGPDMADESLANTLSDQLNLPHIYKGGSDRWQWFYSTDTESYYIATDATSYDPKTNLYSAWIKITNINKPFYRPHHYNFDFTNRSFAVWPSQNMMYVKSGTWQEIVYNGAYDLCKKLYVISDKSSQINNFGFISTRQTT
jgi:hypothetical protein